MSSDGWCDDSRRCRICGAWYQFYRSGRWWCADGHGEPTEEEEAHRMFVRLSCEIAFAYPKMMLLCETPQ
jgi:hypothetical protein